MSKSGFVFTVSPFNSGLNNQKLSIIGGIFFARREGGLFALPDTIIDFVPGAQNRPIKLIDIFDVEKLSASILRHEWLWRGRAADAILLNGSEMFKLGSQLQRKLSEKSNDGMIFRDILASFSPSREIAQIVDHLSGMIGDAIFLQLRIESDWRRYMEKKVLTHGLFPGEELVLSAERIFQKIANTGHLQEFKRIYACCDEQDLQESVKDLKGIALNHGFDLVFKSEIFADTQWSKSRILLSVIDFELARRARAYVGLTRSTFSNNLAFLAAWENGGAQYIYNSTHDFCIQRRDRGMKLAPADVI